MHNIWQAWSTHIIEWRWDCGDLEGDAGNRKRERERERVRCWLGHRFLWGFSPFSFHVYINIYIYSRTFILFLFVLSLHLVLIYVSSSNRIQLHINRCTFSVALTHTEHHGHRWRTEAHGIRIVTSLAHPWHLQHQSNRVRREPGTEQKSIVNRWIAELKRRQTRVKRISCYIVEGSIHGGVQVYMWRSVGREKNRSAGSYTAVCMHARV